MSRKRKFSRSHLFSSSLICVICGRVLPSPHDKDCTRLVQALARRLATAERRPWPEQPVPVALVITELDVGGAEKSLVTLATGLNRRCWAPRVFALGPEAPLAAPIRAAGVEVECLGIDPRRPVRAR